MTMKFLASAKPHKQEDYPLDADVLNALWKMEENHFWHRARNRWISRALEHYGVPKGAAVLEVGCGSGIVGGHLARAGFKVTGLDTAELLIRKAEERTPQVEWIVGDLESLVSEYRGRFQSVGFFDVLEHLDDPGTLLRQSIRLLEPKGLVISTVPARMSLYSQVDALSGHKKRYEIGEMSSLYRECGLQGVGEHGLFRSTLPMFWLQRRNRGVDKVAVLAQEERVALMKRTLSVPAAPTNCAMAMLCWLEGAVGFSLARDKSGSSILAVGQAPA